MALLPTSQFGAWIAKQSGKGAINHVAYDDMRKRLRLIEGGLSTQREYGRETYGDGQRFAAASDYTESIIGSGELTVQGQPGVAGYLAYLALGAEAFTAADAEEGTSSEHVITPAEDGGKWFTVIQEVGEGSDLYRSRFGDCRIQSLSFEASQGTKTLHVNPTIASLSPDEKYGYTPTLGFDASEPLLFTDATGKMVVDGDTIGDISQFQVSINDNLEPYYGDGIAPRDMVPGRSEVEVTFTVAVTSDTLPYFNQVVYGTPYPSAGATPTSSIYFAGVDFTLSRGTGATLEQVQITVPRVAFTPDLAIEGQADGGVVELAFTGQARPNGTDPVITVTTNSVDADDDYAY